MHAALSSASCRHAAGDGRGRWGGLLISGSGCSGRAKRLEAGPRTVAERRWEAALGLGRKWEAGPRGGGAADGGGAVAGPQMGGGTAGGQEAGLLARGQQRCAGRRDP